MYLGKADVLQSPLILIIKAGFNVFLSVYLALLDLQLLAVEVAERQNEMSSLDVPGPAL